MGNRTEIRRKIAMGLLIAAAAIAVVGGAYGYAQCEDFGILWLEQGMLIQFKCDF